MKFKDIKEGDIIYVQKPVRYGSDKAKYFWVPVKVTATMSKQFFIGMSRYRKSDGALMETGDRYSEACRLGDDYNGKKVSDQSKDMKEFFRKIKMAADVREIGAKLNKLR